MYSRRVDNRLAPAPDRHVLGGVRERRPSYWFSVAPCELDHVPLFSILQISIAHLVATDHLARMWISPSNLVRFCRRLNVWWLLVTPKSDTNFHASHNPRFGGQVAYISGVYSVSWVTKRSLICKWKSYSVKSLLSKLWMEKLHPSSPYSVSCEWKSYIRQVLTQ